MPIEAKVKENLIKELKGRQGAEKLRLLGLYKHLIHMYDEDDKYGEIINHNTYNTHERIRELSNRAIQIMRNQMPVVNEDLVDKDEFFTKEEQEGEAFKANAENQPEIQNFWANLLLKIPRLECMIEDVDKQVLNYLDHIEVFRNQDNTDCRIEFTFKENEFFTNQKLVIESVSNKEDDSEIEKIKCEGINWKPSKNFLVSTVQKKSGNKKGKKKVTEKEVRNPSFFWIFKEANAEDFAMDNEDEMDDMDMEPTSDRVLFDMACDFIEIMANDFLVYFIPASFDVKVPNLEDHCHDEEGGDGHVDAPKQQNCKQQ